MYDKKRDHKGVCITESKKNQKAVENHDCYALKRHVINRLQTAFSLVESCKDMRIVCFFYFVDYITNPSLINFGLLQPD